MATIFHLEIVIHAFIKQMAFKKIRHVVGNLGNIDSGRQLSSSLLSFKTVKYYQPVLNVSTNRAYCFSIIYI